MQTETRIGREIRRAPLARAADEAGERRRASKMEATLRVMAMAVIVNHALEAPPGRCA